MKQGIIIFFGVLILVSACRKSDLDILQSDYESVKVYDDTLASAENVNVNISSGSDRIYMGYGRGSTVYSIFNLAFFQILDEISGVVMATDLQGNLIWRQSLPTGLANVTPIELDDGSCFTAGADMYDYNISVPNEKLHVFHFDRNGKQLLHDSIVLPVADFFAEMVFYSIDVIKISGTDALIYGTVGNSSTWQSWKGFMILYNAYSGVQWIKKMNYPASATSDDKTCIYNCIRTNDGGLMFLGAYEAPAQPFVPPDMYNILIKTNTSGDVVWKKQYGKLKTNPTFNQVSPANILQMAGGDYFFCVNDVVNLGVSVLEFQSDLYHISPSGDSLNLVTVTGGKIHTALRLLITATEK